MTEGGRKLQGSCVSSCGMTVTLKSETDSRVLRIANDSAVSPTLFLTSKPAWDCHDCSELQLKQKCTQGASKGVANALSLAREIFATIDCFG